MPVAMQSKIAQRSLQFAVRVIHIHHHMTVAGGAARTLSPQLLRAAASIGANLEEATAAQSKADFVSKVSIAHKEARETVVRILATIRLNARSNTG